ncbi:MAG: hypothetical protein DWH96_09755 [Planctomycetota bacterium]|nr:MAG: hypothetical protein DWH96_09755 [Planctomycetota bacterium]
MSSRYTLSFFAAALSFSSVASAALYVSPNEGIYDTLVASIGCTSYTETFGSTPTGFLASGYSSSTGPVNWSATATGGLYVQAGLFSTNNAGQALTFDFSAPGLSVQAVGGNFFATDVSFNVVPAVVVVLLDDGTSYVNLMTLESSFVGFISTGAAISSITLSLPLASDLYPTVDRMVFGVVPAPGAIALLGLAGFVGLRRRGS